MLVSLLAIDGVLEEELAAAAAENAAAAMACGFWWFSTHFRICFSSVLGTEKGMLQNLQ